MHKRMFGRGVAALLLLPMLFAASRGEVLAAPLPQVNVEMVCNQVFLPMVMSGGPATGGEPAPGQSTLCNAAPAFPDFNGDGYADLAVGVPYRDIFNGIVTVADAGQVQVIYGSPAGLAADDQAVQEDQIWHRALGGVTAAAGDHYGRALAMGDFNQDGYDDLAVGIAGANISGQDNAGAVQVIYGSATGLAVATIDEWSRGSGLQGTVVANTGLGSALATGDFDADGYADLAMGAPFAVVGGDDDAGAVHILYGRGAGLGQVGNELLTQDTAGFSASEAEADDYFGLSLAAGDFNGNGVDDLAVGAPREDNGVYFANAGAVQVFFGRSGNTALDSGLIGAGGVLDPQHWTANSAHVEGVMEADELFGLSLASADFNGDGYADLAVGIPVESHGSGASALELGGAVNVLHGSAAGLEATAENPVRLWHQDSTGMEDTVSAEDVFGYALAAADFDGDGYADLAVGVPQNQLFGVSMGAVHMLYGTASGLTAARNAVLLDPVGPALDDVFGSALSAGDFNGDGRADLAVGAHGDDPVGPGATETGSVFTFAGASGGIAPDVFQHWYPGHLGLRSTPAVTDLFGSALPGSADLP